MKLLTALILSFIVTCLSSFSVVAKSPSVTVGVYEFPPFIHIEDETVKGYYVDLLREVATRIDVKFDFVPCPFVRCVSMIKNSQLDLLPGLLKTPDRTKLMGFIDTPIDFTESVYQFFSLNASQQVKSLADLNSYTVGKRRGSVYFEAFDNDKIIKKIDFIDYETIIKMVLNGRIDYFIYAGSEIDELLITLDTDQQLKPASFVVTERKYGYLAASKTFKSSPLSVLISDGLARMIKDGTLLTLAQKNKVETALEPPE